MLCALLGAVKIVGDDNRERLIGVGVHQRRAQSAAFQDVLERLAQSAEHEAAVIG